MPLLAKDDLLAWLGKTKTAARRTVSAYLKTMPLDVRVHDPKLLGLCQFHPTRKFPPSDVAFVLSACPPYYTKALYVEARSGGLVDFSWIKCIENLYGKYTKAKDARANTLSALRNEAFQSGAIQAARKGLGTVCARCGTGCRKLVVDHDVKPFVQILDEFLERNGIALADLKVRGSKDGFRLRSMGRQWRAFHDENATLVGLCPRCNGSLNSRGYRARFH